MFSRHRTRETLFLSSGKSINEQVNIGIGMILADREMHQHGPQYHITTNMGGGPLNATWARAEMITA